MLPKALLQPHAFVCMLRYVCNRELAGNLYSSRKNTTYLDTGFAHFFRPKIQGLFKDFQGPNFEISRTSCYLRRIIYQWKYVV